MEYCAFNNLILKPLITINREIMPSYFLVSQALSKFLLCLPSKMAYNHKISEPFQDQTKILITYFYFAHSPAQLFFLGNLLRAHSMAYM